MSNLNTPQLLIAEIGARSDFLAKDSALSYWLAEADYDALKQRRAYLSSEIARDEAQAVRFDRLVSHLAFPTYVMSFIFLAFIFGRALSQDVAFLSTGVAAVSAVFAMFLGSLVYAATQASRLRPSARSDLFERLGPLSNDDVHELPRRLKHSARAQAWWTHVTHDLARPLCRHDLILIRFLSGFDEKDGAPSVLERLYAFDSAGEDPRDTRALDAVFAQLPADDRVTKLHAELHCVSDMSLTTRFAEKKAKDFDKQRWGLLTAGGVYEMWDAVHESPAARLWHYQVVHVQKRHFRWADMHLVHGLVRAEQAGA